MLNIQNNSNKQTFFEKVKSMLIGLFANKLKRDFIWNVGVLGISGILVILSNTIVTRIRGFGGLGLYSQALAPYIMISQIAVWGIHFSVLRGVSYNQDNPKKSSEIYSSGLILVFFTSLIIGSVFFMSRFLIADFFDSEGVADAILYISPGIVFLSMYKVLANALNATRRMRVYGSFQALRVFSYVIGTMIILALKLPNTHLTLAMTFSEIIAFFSIFLYLNFRFHRFILNKKVLKMIPEHLVFGSKGFLSGFLFNVNLRIDIIMIGFVYSDAITGIYYYATQIIEGANEITYIMRKNADPVIGKLFSENKTEEIGVFLREIKKKFYPFMFVFGIIAIAGFPLLGIIKSSSADFVLSDFIESWKVFIILMLGIMIVAGYRPSFWILVQAGYPGTFTKVMLVAVGFNIVFNALLISFIGIYGAAIATALNYALQAFLVVYLSRRMLNIKL